MTIKNDLLGLYQLVREKRKAYYIMVEELNLTIPQTLVFIAISLVLLIAALKSVRNTTVEIELPESEPEPEQRTETKKTQDTVTAVKQEVAIDVDSLVSQLQKKFAGASVVEPKAVQTENKSYSDKVRVDLQCPFCGIAKAIKVPKTLTFIKCPGCNGKIFLSWATGVKGEVDEHGYYYKANSPMQFKNQKDEYKEMFGIEENDQ